jgi:hypothetical protein
MTDRGTGEFYFFANPASGTVFLYLAPMLDLVMQRP